MDFNGILHLLSQFAYWIQSGGIATWNEELDYIPPATVCASNNKYYKCKASSGLHTEVGPKDPTLEATTDYWVLNDPEAEKPLSAILGEIRVLPFRNTELPNGWYYANGDKFALTTAQGTVLNAFSTTFKNDWGITSTEVNGVATINIPNLFASDGTGATLIPCNGTSLPIGGIQEDAGRNATGSCDAVMNFVNIGGCWSNSNYAPNSQAASPAYGFHGLIMDLSRAWGAAHTSTRFKIYGRGATPAMYLGV